MMNNSRQVQAVPSKADHSEAVKGSAALKVSMISLEEAKEANHSEMYSRNSKSFSQVVAEPEVVARQGHSRQQREETLQ